MLDWSNDQAAPFNTGGNASGNVDNFLHQFIEGKTHEAGNKLDLLLCYCPETIEKVTTTPADECGFPSDHYIIDFIIRLKFERTKPVKRQVFNYYQANFESLRHSLSRIPFENISSYDNIDDRWSCWKTLFITAVSEHVPTKFIKDVNTPPWIDQEVRHLIRKKYSALKRYRKNQSDALNKKLRDISEAVKCQIKRKYREYLTKIEKSLNYNPKTFWSYHKAMLHQRTNHISAIIYNGVTANNPIEKAELLNAYFTSVFSKTNREH